MFVVPVPNSYMLNVFTSCITHDKIPLVTAHLSLGQNYLEYKPRCIYRTCTWKQLYYYWVIWTSLIAFLIDFQYTDYLEAWYMCFMPNRNIIWMISVNSFSISYFKNLCARISVKEPSKKHKIIGHILVLLWGLTLTNR